MYADGVVAIIITMVGPGFAPDGGVPDQPITLDHADTIIDDGAIAIEGRRIVGVGRGPELRDPCSMEGRRLRRSIRAGVAGQSRGLHQSTMVGEHR